MLDTIPEDRCIACTSCTVICPVAKATPNFLGPRMMGPAHERFRLMCMGEDDSLHYCANCKNCEITCPNNVPVATFIMRARARVAREKHPPLRDWILANGATMGKWVGHFPASLTNFGMNFPLTRYVLDLLGIHRSAPLPRFARRNFRHLFASLRQPAGLSRKVAYFPGCFVNLYDPESGADLVWLLNHAGYEVMLPNFDCCGLPQVANAFWDSARDNAIRNVKTLAALQAQGIPVITGCTSCGLMFKDDYLQFFPEEVKAALADKRVPVEDACEFLQGCLDREELRLPEKVEGRTLRVLYHAPCHLRAQGMGLPGLELLRATPGLEVTDADAGCCGISGSYGFKKEKYGIGLAIGADLFRVMRKSGALLAVSECGTCRVQMRHGGGLPSLHPLTLLRRQMERSLS